jgi:hypothetical protein
VAPVRHRAVRHPAKRKPVHKKAHKKAVGRPGQPLVAAGPPIPASSGASSPALFIIAFGVTAALVGVALGFMPASAVPFALGLRYERSRLTILVVGLAIGVACALVGLLTILAGR